MRGGFAPQRQSSFRRRDIQKEVHLLIAASELAKREVPPVADRITPASPDVGVVALPAAASIETEQLFRGESTLVHACNNELAGKKEFDTISRFVEEKEVPPEPPRILHFCDVVSKIKKDAFLARIRALKEEMREKENLGLKKAAEEKE